MEVTICNKCKFYRWTNKCVSDDAPVSNYLDGSKIATTINLEGKCFYYKDKQPPPDTYPVRE